MMTSQFSILALAFGYLSGMALAVPAMAASDVSAEPMIYRTQAAQSETPYASVQNVLAWPSLSPSGTLAVVATADNADGFCALMNRTRAHSYTVGQVMAVPGTAIVGSVNRYGVGMIQRMSESTAKVLASVSCE